MKRLLYLVILVQLGLAQVGCGATTPQGGTTPASEPAASPETERLQVRTEEQAREIRALRAELALSRAQTDELRVQSPQTPTPTETVRIGDTTPSDDGLLFFDDEESSSGWDQPSRQLPPAPRAERNRPTIRLYGVAEPADVPPPPGGMTPTLPVAATPPLSAAPPLTYTGALPPQSSAEAPSPLPWRAASPDDYRRALGLLRARQFDEALAVFTRISAVQPRHPHAASARYWRAEVLYIKRRYSEALRAFQTYLSRHPQGVKAPDALLKVGYCRQRLGDAAGAQQAFVRLRHEYPQSEAARLAGREDV